MLDKKELLEACETAEKAAAGSELVQVLREMLPTLSPDQCPADAREEWLALNLMIQPRPSAPAAAGPAWLTRLAAWMSRLESPAPRYALARVGASH